MYVLVAKLGTCEGCDVGLVESVYIYLVDSTKYLLGLLVGTEDGT